VNGRLVPLDTMLQSADTAEIITPKCRRPAPRVTGCRSCSPGPQQDRQWFSRERREDAMDTGATS